MKIVKGIEILGLSLWLKEFDTVIISDLHLGYEEALNKQGVLIPRTEFKEVIQKLEWIFKKAKPKRKPLPKETSS